MYKVIGSDSFGYQDSLSTIVKRSSKGIVGADFQALVKAAGSDFAAMAKTIEMPADELPVHLVAMGATEAWGPNRNGDGFKEAELKRSHKTFEKLAKFYRNHKNQDPAKSYGVVKLAFYNPEMRRVELLAGLNKTAEAARRNGGLIADREMEKLEKKADLAVSMACVLDPKYPVLTRDRGYVGIADIAVGDYVWTKAGRWRRVYQLNRRTYTGQTFTFRSSGQPLELELTADHPMWAKVFEGSKQRSAVGAKARRYFQNTAAFENEAADWAHAQHINVGDRFFYKPVTRYTGYGKIADANLAAIMGYYLAEGNFGYNGTKASVTQFSCNMSDSLPRRLPRLVESMYPDVTVSISPRRNSDVALSVEVMSTEFSEFLRRYVGRGAEHKVIPPEIFNADRDVKLAFLGAWMDGDGFVDVKGGHWSSCNIGTIMQGRDLLVSLGIPASIYRIDHSKCATSGYKNSGIEYTLNIQHRDMWVLASASEKAAGYPQVESDRSKPSSMRLCPDGTYAYRVSKVESRMVTDAQTYNFEVEDDESYSLGGYISHNCRIAHDTCSVCDNKAKRRSEYCESIKEGGSCPGFGCMTGLTKVADDGHVQHVDNVGCNFIDISDVGRPADRTAFGNVADYMLKAASGAVIGGAQLAEMWDLFESANGFGTDTEAIYTKLAMSLADSEAAWELKLASGSAGANIYRALNAIDTANNRPTQALLGAPGTDKSRESLAILAREKIAMPLFDFLSWLTDSPEKAAALTPVVADRLPGLYKRLLKSGSLYAGNPYIPAKQVFDRDVAQWAKRYAEWTSLDSKAVFKRAAVSAMRYDGYPTLTKTSAVVSPEIANGLAEQYGLYKLAFLAQQTAEVPLTTQFVVSQNYHCSK